MPSVSATAVSPYVVKFGGFSSPFPAAESPQEAVEFAARLYNLATVCEIYKNLAGGRPGVVAQEHVMDVRVEAGRFTVVWDRRRYDRTPLRPRWHREEGVARDG